jgi:hypothetical protein
MSGFAFADDNSKGHTALRTLLRNDWRRDRDRIKLGMFSKSRGHRGLWLHLIRLLQTRRPSAETVPDLLTPGRIDETFRLLEHRLWLASCPKPVPAPVIKTLFIADSFSVI